jgi:aminoglycoside phosphotransferase (APT) family kinase protein
VTALALQQGRVDFAALVARIRAEFPQLGFCRAILNDDGEDHAVVILDDARVFRFPRTAECASYAARERRLLEQLRHTSSLPMPEYRWVSVAGDFAGYPMIPGRPLSEALFAGLSRDVQEQVLGEIGGFLARLHRLPASLVTSQNTATGTAWSGADYVRRYRGRRERIASTLPRKLLVRIDRFFESLPEIVDRAPPVLIHGDLSEDHILLAPHGDRLGGVIDFTDAGVGDPAFDFTFLWAYGDWGPACAALAYGGGDATSEIVARSRWWFIRYSIDRIWWNLSGARPCDTAKVEGDIRRSLDALDL